MSCFSFLSSLFGRGERINGRSYTVVRRIGEGGEHKTPSNTIIILLYYTMYYHNYYRFLLC